jgi:hypothetical protein
MLVFTRHPIASYSEGKREGQWLIELNQEVADAWLEITGDSFIVQGVAWDGSITEIVKYMTKSAESLPADELKELTSWARGMRSVSAFGNLYGKQIPEDVEEEDIEEGGTFMAIVRRFDTRAMDYVERWRVIIELDQGATVRDIFSLVMKRE